MAALSGSGSKLVMTCIDTELLEASRGNDPVMGASHVFANLWHFDVGNMMACQGYASHWITELAPVSTRQLALEWLDADTYVALYGGAECVLTARLRESTVGH
jgi:hypothetical protein